MNEIIKYITKEEIDLNEEIFKKYFNFQRPSDMIMLLNKTNDTGTKKKLGNLINSGLKDVKEEIKKMSEVEIVEKILKFNKQNQQHKNRIQQQ